MAKSVCEIDVITAYAVPSECAPRGRSTVVAVSPTCRPHACGGYGASRRATARAGRIPGECWGRLPKHAANKWVKRMVCLRFHSVDLVQIWRVRPMQTQPHLGHSYSTWIMGLEGVCLTGGRIRWVHRGASRPVRVSTVTGKIWPQNFQEAVLLWDIAISADSKSDLIASSHGHPVHAEEAFNHCILPPYIHVSFKRNRQNHVRVRTALARGHAPSLIHNHALFASQSVST